MAYKRWIAYFDLIDNEQKRGNAGFVKWEQYDECHILSVFINGLADIYSKETDVYLEGQNSIGKLNIKNGKADGTYLLTRGEKNWREVIRKLRIPIENGKELLALFDVGEAKAVLIEKEDLQEKELIEETRESVKERELLEEKRESVPKEELVEEKKESVIEQRIEEEKRESKPIIEQKLEKETRDSEQAIMSESSQVKQIQTINWNKESQQIISQELKEDKSFWEMLETNHELIYPFGNDIGCFRIFPKDIVMLQPQYHPLQNNQFLMHGYYNYRHLIVCKKENQENEFWLGVPGIYHEREKMAARMFGFEKFEGTKPKYKTGDLGYYLITVE